MNGKFLVACLVAALAGATGAIAISHSFFVRDSLGQFCGKGQLLVIAGGEGVYQTDVERAVAETISRGGGQGADANDANRLRRQVVAGLAANAAVTRSASREKLSGAETDREFDLLRFQFRDRNTFLAALRTSNLSERSLRQLIAENLRARHWTDRRVDAKPAATSEECADFYKTHLQDFSLPVRWRVSHLFLAAPPETPPDIVDLKRERIEGLAERLKSGEPLADLIAAESEDEASKLRQGDLGFFASSRVPADFLGAAEKLAPGEVSGPVQTTLGFHLIQGMERKPAEQLSFDQAREEISSILAGQSRLAALRKLDVDLASLIRFRPGFSRAQP